MGMSKVLKAGWSAGWRITTFLVVWGILLGPIWVAVIQWLEARQLTDSPVARLGLEACAAATVVIAAGLVLRFVDRMPFGSLGLGRRSSMAFFSAGLALGAGMMAAAVLALWLVGIATIHVPSAPPGIALALAGTAVFFNSVTQEVLVQGYILQTIERQSSSLSAVLLSAALFTLLHGPAIQAPGLAAPNIYLAGLLLGAGYVLSRSLWLSIGIHFGWNFVQGPLLGLGVSGHDLGAASGLVVLEGPRVLTGGTFGLEGGVIATAVTLIGTAALLAGFGTRAREALSIPKWRSRTTTG